MRFGSKSDVMVRPLALIIGGNIFGKIVGLAREVLFAAFFGTTSVAGSYRVAQTATLVPINFVTGDSLTAAFIPLYIRYKQQHPTKARILFKTILAGFGIVALAIWAVLSESAGRWIGLLAPGLSGASAILAADLLRVLALSVPFYTLTMVFASVEVAEGRYLLVSLRSTVQSLGLILGTIGAYYAHNPILLAWGFTCSYASLSIAGLVLAVKRGWLNRAWSLSIALDVLRDFWRNVRPLIALPILLQGNIALERAVASLLGIAVVSALDYAKFIGETGIQFMAYPLGLIGLSTLSGLSPVTVRNYLDRALPVVTLISVMVSTFVGIHASEIVAIVYQRGRFDAESSQVTAAVLSGIGLGLWAQIIGYLFIRVLNAGLRNTEVMRHMGWALLANGAVNVICSRVMGPFALGLGNAVYGAVVMLLAARTLGVTERLRHSLKQVLPGVAGYLGLAAFLPEVGSALDRLVIAGLAYLTYWSLYIISVKPLRTTVWVLIRGRGCGE